MSKAQKLTSGIFALVFALAIAPTASFAATNYGSVGNVGVKVAD